MAERVETGGLMRFDYSKSEQKRMGEKDRKEIEVAYEKYDERKRKEKRNRLIIALIVVILIAGAIALYLNS